MTTKEVLAKAEHLNRKVVAVTHGTSLLGKAICEYAALAGASVFALDSDITLLAQQSISFRQNKLRLRGIPCELASQNSISNAIQEIVSHAPPIDYWIHAEVLSPADVSFLKPAVHAFVQHFEMRGKGHFLIIGTQPQQEELATALDFGLPMDKFREKVKVSIVIPETTSTTKIAKQTLLHLQ